MTNRKSQVRWIVTVAAAVVIADQVTKGIVRATVDPGVQSGENVFLRIVYHENPGIVGGAFRDVPFVGYVAPVLAFAVLVYLFRHLSADSRWQWIGYSMVLGGAIGNITDRVLLGAVTDFVQVHFYFVPFDFPWKFFPAFNVADACIDIGVVLLLITWGWHGRRDVARTD